MSPPRQTVFRKTDRAAQELRARSFGLNARVRQVLILLDGQRRVADLERLVPADELQAHLHTLEDGGFIERVPTGGGREGADVPAILPETIPPPAPMAHEGGDLPVAPSSLPELRRRLVRALLDATGPHGDTLATRIERCSTIDELRSLVAPATSIVEAVGGKRASALFLARVGRV